MSTNLTNLTNEAKPDAALGPGALVRFVRFVDNQFAASPRRRRVRLIA